MNAAHSNGTTRLGHNPHLEGPERCHPQLLRFLKSESTTRTAKTGNQRP